MTDLKDLFGESDDDDDDFTPAERNKPQASPAPSEEGKCLHARISGPNYPAGSPNSNEVT